ncbi:MAG TPA: alpha/beta hydrolase [Chitinophagaceae bacterium]|nr:alpha/beta hydrolase [Chitinophagaceae bacterium]
MHTPRLRYFSKPIAILGLLMLPFISKSQSTHIEEKGFIKINGIEQWITITGERSKPVIFFLHGGPGSPLSPYADALFSGWEKDFILVQWDQRGAGRTFGRTAPEELTPAYLKSHPLPLETMTEDAIKVAEYLARHLGKSKIIVFGTSWGSVLGIQLAEKRPDLFSAYIGHSQVVYPSDNLKSAFPKVSKMAIAANDENALKILASIGEPPYDTAKHAGQLLRIIKKYERLHSKQGPDALLNISAEYDNEKDSQHRSDGDDYSFVNFVGDKRFGVTPMSQPASGLIFQIPIYFIQGNEDILTPKEVSKPYFESITAPKKEYILLPETAHGFNPAVIEALLQICRKIK